MRLEHWFFTIPLRLRSLFRRRQIEQELEEEFQLHLEAKIQQAIAAGQTPEEARYAALRAMEGMEQRKEDCRDVRGVRWFDDLLQDGRYAVRTLAKSPSFTLVAILVLGLGIGVNTAIFTVVNAVLLQPLPFPEPNRLFLLTCAPKNNPFIRFGDIMSDRDYVEFRGQDKMFESLATFNRETSTLTGAGDPAVMNALDVTPNFLTVLRVHPALGRGFLPEGQTDTNAVLLSDQLWHSRFGADPQIAGKAITLDGTSYTVAGVMPANFTFQNADLWKRTEIRLNPHNSMMRPVIGRLRANVSPERAQAELQTFAARRPRAKQDRPDDFVGRVLPLKELFVSGVRKLLLIFAGAVLCVFLIACANFANLLLIRAAARQPEIMVRAALGAGRWRIVRQLLVESTLLSLLGGALGVLLSLAGIQTLLVLLPPGKIPRAENVHLDSWALLFTLGLSLLTGIIFGLAPGLQATAREFRETTSAASRNVTNRHERLRGSLVVVEIALAVLLLMGAGLLVRSFLRIQSVNPGFQPSNLLAETVDLPDSRYHSAAQMRELDGRVLESLAMLPGVESVAAVNWIPMRPELVSGDFALADGRRLPEGFLADKLAISSAYFRTMNIQFLAGRPFNEHDNASASGVAIVSESVARRLWPSGDAVGKRISMEDNPKAEDWLTIVGIVRDVRQRSLTEAPSASIYQPSAQINQPFFLRHMSFLVQAKDNPATLIAGMRTAVRKADSQLPTQSITTLASMVGETVTEQRSQTRLLTLFSLMALFLASIGIYGILAFSVAERTREIGIRMALGASVKEVLGMVLRRTLLLVGAGALIGTLLALAVGQAIEKFLFEVTPTDPLTFFTVIAILLLVALLSAWAPAQRAARVDPLIALRYE